MTSSTCFLLALVACAAGADEPGRTVSHQRSNPVFAALVAEAAGHAEDAAAEPAGGVQLPLPVMGDGLNADQQRAILRSVAGDRYDVDDLLRPSVVAPHVLRMRREPIEGGVATLQRVAVYFAGQGDLDAISDRDFLDSLLATDEDQEEGESRALTEAELRSAGVDRSPPHPDHDFVQRIRGTIFDRIQLRGVGRTFWSRSEDSIVVAMMIDPRFANVAGLRPTWERFERREDGSLASAETGRFAGGGVYVKITQLEEPRGHLFVEAQMALIEPRAWFGGANLLGSKLPPAIQSKVRDIRRQAIRATREPGR